MDQKILESINKLDLEIKKLEQEKSEFKKKVEKILVEKIMEIRKYMSYNQLAKIIHVSSPMIRTFITKRGSIYRECYMQIITSIDIELIKSNYYMTYIISKEEMKYVDILMEARVYMTLYEIGSFLNVSHTMISRYITGYHSPKNKRISILNLQDLVNNRRDEFFKEIGF